MPVIKCSNGKYRIGTGACIYQTEEKAQKAWAAIRAASSKYIKQNSKDLKKDKR